MSSSRENGRSLGALFTAMKEELREFAQLRIELLETELRDNAENLKLAIPLAAVGALLLFTAFMLVTLGLVSGLAAYLRDNPYRWAFGFATLAIVLGGVFVYAAMRRFSLKGLIPRKTIQVLKGDKLWLQTEVKSQI